MGARDSERERMALKEGLARLRRKINDIVFLNQDYITRQFDTAPARFRDSNAGFRQPAPGSQPEPNIPIGHGHGRGDGAERSKFDIRYFDRDKRRAPETVLTLSTGQKLIAADEEATFGEAGVAATTGLGGLPIHLPRPTWTRDAETIQKHLEANNLPPVAGAPHKFKPGTELGFSA